MKDMDLLYKCLICGKSEVVKTNDPQINDMVCEMCKWHSSFKGYVGVDIARHEDKTVSICPRSKEMKKR